MKQVYKMIKLTFFSKLVALDVIFSTKWSDKTSLSIKNCSTSSIIKCFVRVTLFFLKTF